MCRAPLSTLRCPHRVSTLSRSPGRCRDCLFAVLTYFGALTLRIELLTFVTHARTSARAVFFSHSPRPQQQTSMATYKIVLVRHGLSDYNDANKFCGWCDDICVVFWNVFVLLTHATGMMPICPKWA